jgi:hypothetical protein
VLAIHSCVLAQFLSNRHLYSIAVPTNISLSLLARKQDGVVGGGIDLHILTLEVDEDVWSGVKQSGFYN